MIQRPVSFTVLLLITASIVGCAASTNTADKNARSKETVTTIKPQIDIRAKNRPKIKKDTIVLEGMKEKHSFTLVDSPELEFTTYIDEDLTASVGSTGEGDSLFVYANFAGKVNENAVAHVFAKTKDAESTVDEISRLVREVVEKGGFKVEYQRGGLIYEFSEEEFRIVKQKQDGTYIMGHVSVFKHNNRTYWLIVKYPEDYEEGFVPRVVKMIEDIMWYDEKS